MVYIRNHGTEEHRYTAEYNNWIADGTFYVDVIKYYFDQHCPIDNGSVLIDFEKAVMNAFENSFPGWDVSNCYFHHLLTLNNHDNTIVSMSTQNFKLSKGSAQINILKT